MELHLKVGHTISNIIFHVQIMSWRTPLRRHQQPVYGIATSTHFYNMISRLKNSVSAHNNIPLLLRLCPL